MPVDLTRKKYISQFSHKEEERLIIQNGKVVIDSERAITYKGLTIPLVEYAYIVKSTSLAKKPHLVIILSNGEEQPHILLAELPYITRIEQDLITDFLLTHGIKPYSVDTDHI